MGRARSDQLSCNNHVEIAAVYAVHAHGGRSCRSLLPLTGIGQNSAGRAKGAQHKRDHTKVGPGAFARLATPDASAHRPDMNPVRE